MSKSASLPEKLSSLNALSQEKLKLPLLEASHLSSALSPSGSFAQDFDALIKLSSTPFSSKTESAYNSLSEKLFKASSRKGFARFAKHSFLDLVNLASDESILDLLCSIVFKPDMQLFNLEPYHINMLGVLVNAMKSFSPGMRDHFSSCANKIVSKISNAPKKVTQDNPLYLFFAFNVVSFYWLFLESKEIATSMLPVDTRVVVQFLLSVYESKDAFQGLDVTEKVFSIIYGLLYYHRAHLLGSCKGLIKPFFLAVKEDSSLPEEDLHRVDCALSYIQSKEKRKLPVGKNASDSAVSPKLARFSLVAASENSSSENKEQEQGRPSSP